MSINITLNKEALEGGNRLTPEGRYEGARFRAVRSFNGGQRVSFEFSIPKNGVEFQNCHMGSTGGPKVLVSTLTALGVDVQALFAPQDEDDEVEQVSIDIAQALADAKATEVPLIAYVSHNKKDGTTYANVTSVVPLERASGETPEGDPLDEEPV